MEIDLRRRLPLVVLCFVLASVGVIESMAHLQLTGPGWDAAAYWDAWRGSMYDGSVGDPGHYLYSPAFAQVVWPLAHTRGRSSRPCSSRSTASAWPGS